MDTTFTKLETETLEWLRYDGERFGANTTSIGLGDDDVNEHRCGDICRLVGSIVATEISLSFLLTFLLAANDDENGRQWSLDVAVPAIFLIIYWYCFPGMGLYILSATTVFICIGTTVISPYIEMIDKDIALLTQVSLSSSVYHLLMSMYGLFKTT